MFQGDIRGMEKRILQNLIQLKSSDVANVRENILHEQQGICLVCKNEIEQGTACLDHDHKKKVGGTGRIRGVLCRNCNIFVAKSENNCKRYGISKAELPQVLRNMADYFERDQYPLIHPSEAPKKKVVTKASWNKMYSWHAKNGTAKRIKPYLMRGNKKVQGLTKPLKKMFEMAGVEPEFYK
jgi:hypothetical protein